RRPSTLSRNFETRHITRSPSANGTSALNASSMGGPMYFDMHLSDTGSNPKAASAWFMDRAIPSAGSLVVPSRSKTRDRLFMKSNDKTQRHDKLARPFRIQGT